MERGGVDMQSQALGKNRRCFIRHPVSMTVQCRKEGHIEVSANEIRDISFGGMYFISADSYVPGDIVEMEFPPLTLRNRITGEIIWSSPVSLKPAIQFSNGLKFLSKRVLFMARMIEQMCCIEKYREAQVRESHRALSGDQAAREWIQMCAAHFPGA
jgi:PilZ domain